MPRPVFIICAHDIVEDKSTNLVSIFTVLERMRVFKPSNENDGNRALPERRSGGVPAQFRSTKALAVWMSLPGDDENAFEHEFIVEIGDDSRTVLSEPLSFGECGTLKRFVLNLMGFPVPKSSCMASVVSRIRRVGTEDWQAQSFPIRVDVIDDMSTDSTITSGESRALEEATG